MGAVSHPVLDALPRSRAVGLCKLAELVSAKAPPCYRADLSALRSELVVLSELGLVEIERSRSTAGRSYQPTYRRIG